MNCYKDAAAEALERLRRQRKFNLLAIESSCDETAAAVLTSEREVRSMAVHTQIPLHQRYGGVVPEIASRSHVERVGDVVKHALNDAEMSMDDIDAIAVTCGPGLVGALLVGVSYAKGLAFSRQLPLIGVNHIAGHIAANYISHTELEPPFVCLIASGGHSHIVEVSDYTRFRLIGCTRDDAAGEAFDKVARVLGLPYPGGPQLEKLARSGDENAYALHAGFNAKPILDFSFSGLKTAVINLLHNAEQAGKELNKADVAASFQRAVVDTLVTKSVNAALEVGCDKLVLAGGVSANTLLRSRLRDASEARGIKFYCPDMKYCTDNAAMIGCAGYYGLLGGDFSLLDLNANPAQAL